MFIYLSKKIAIPNSVKLRCLGWNKDEGWIACGGEAGLVKVLKLDSVQAKEAAARGLAAPSNLSMNQTLEGHSADVVCVTWNDKFQKLTTSDSNGLIIVWMLYKGMWYEEMINNRNKSVVRAMRWTSDGSKICIGYEDGMVIVGSVDGNRLWGKELKINLCQVEWSPDGRTLLFGTNEGEVQVFDASGSFVHKMPIFCLDESSRSAKIIGVEWYCGPDTGIDPDVPTLAVAYDNGRVQIMRNQYDEKPTLIDTCMKATHMKWCPVGTVLAMCGSAIGGDVAENSIQFYTPSGQHLRSLKVPGQRFAGISWEGGGLRLSLAVDSFIYFANVRPDYKWGFFGSTLVYAYSKPDRAEHCVVFWDTKTDDRVVKYVKKLILIRAAGESCVLVTKTEDSQQYLLILCNAIGTPVDSKYIDVEPVHVTMTRFHVVVSSEEVVYVWQYSTAMTKLTSVEAPGIAAAAFAGVKRKEGRERMFHIDDLPTNEAVLLRKVDRRTNDAVCCLAASDQMLLVGRESGLMHRYALPHIALEHKYVLRCRPHSMALNCTSARVSIIDIDGVLTFFDLNARPEGTAPSAPLGQHLAFERKDVWDMKWSDDNPEQFVLMEKTRMYILRGLDVEEPVTSSAYLCRFNNLKIKAVLLDEIISVETAAKPERPSKETVINFETKSLRDSRNILATVGIKEATQFIEDNPHPRLWRILAEAALDRLDFNIADRAFVKCQDYHGIQLVKRLRVLDDKVKQQAEVAVYFKRFDEAEEMYAAIDRRDLALDMRMRLGDWFKVLSLCQSGVGDDTLRLRAQLEIGDYYADRQRWAEAVTYYQQCNAQEKLVECFYMLENFDQLERVMKALPDKHPLLVVIGDKFMTMGIHEHAVTAFQRGGDIKGAIDCCVVLNQWDLAVDLAQKHNFPNIEALLSKYASHLLEKGKMVSAIELYRKANHHLDSAKLLMKLARESVAAEPGTAKVTPLLAKKLYILAALEVEQHRRRAANLQVTRGFQGGANALDSLLSADAGASAQAVAAVGSSAEGIPENAWHGAEAFHFFLLAQRQLYDGLLEAALVTALRLRDYEDILGQYDVYALIALCAYHCRYFGQCSRAFIVLESLDLSVAKRTAVEDLALNIFVKSPPKDPPRRKVACTTCDGQILDWDTSCRACETTFPACVASGRPVRDTAYYVCGTCKHRILDDNTSARLAICPLCHARV